MPVMFETLTDESLRERLAAMETRYSMDSDTFYARYLRGEMPCSERAYTQWAGLCYIERRLKERH